MATKIIICGMVQGVFCRDYCRQYAKRMKLHGSATNNNDGSVTVLLDSEDDDVVNNFIEAIKNNPADIRFFGKISTISIAKHGGSLYGEYQF